MSAPRPFNSLYRHGFARVAVCVPRVKVANPKFNAEQTIALARRAATYAVLGRPCRNTSA